MIARREFLVWTLSGVGLLGVDLEVAAADNPAPPQPGSFTPTMVIDRARALAKTAYKAQNTDLPAPFGSLNYEQYVAIRLKPEALIWVRDNVGFSIEPLSRGYIFTAPVALNLVEDGVPKPVALTASAFDFGKVSAPPPATPVGLSGFRVLETSGSASPIEVAIFQGASFMRALARGQNLGVVSRALSIRTADPKGEEFPSVREVWIERPSLATDALVVHALIDSESMTGAYRFTLRPGDVTIVDTECTLFSRVAVENYGLGGMTAMFEFNPIARRNVDDVRTAVCEVSGLQMLNGKGEWIWRPVANRDTLQVSAFIDTNPGGFGLLQRDRAFARFQDDDQHWEQRPSLWIEPIGEWGEGSVQLVEIPTDSEINDNIICFWRPKAPMAAAAEASFAYRQFWCWSPPNRPNLATVTDSRAGRGSSGKLHRFLVEFGGDQLADANLLRAIKPSLSTSLGTIASVQSFSSQDRRTYRVLFEIDPGGESLAEMRLVLENDGKPVSETWLYRWTA